MADKCSGSAFSRVVEEMNHNCVFVYVCGDLSFFHTILAQQGLPQAFKKLIKAMINISYKDVSVGGKGEFGNVASYGENLAIFKLMAF